MYPTLTRRTSHKPMRLGCTEKKLGPAAKTSLEADAFIILAQLSLPRPPTVSPLDPIHFLFHLHQQVSSFSPTPALLTAPTQHFVRHLRQPSSRLPQPSDRHRQIAELVTTFFVDLPRTTHLSTHKLARPTSSWRPPLASHPAIRVWDFATECLSCYKQQVISKNQPSRCRARRGFTCLRSL